MLKSPKQQIVLVGFSTILAVFSLSSIVVFSDPFKSSWITFGFLYLSLFLSSLGLFTLLGIGIRQVFKQKVYVINLSNSFRQGLLISAFITVCFILQAQQLLFWWVGLSLIMLLLFVEIFLNLKI
jgi:hypothetical protein